MTVPEVDERRFVPRNFMRAYLLLLICESPDHGYGLVARLAHMGIADGGPGTVYRALRGLESAGLVASRWVESRSGPRKRIYVLTSAGRASLDSWTDALHEAANVLTDYLNRYARHTACAAEPAAG